MIRVGFGNEGNKPVFHHPANDSTIVCFQVDDVGSDPAGPYVMLYNIREKELDILRPAQLINRICNAEILTLYGKAIDVKDTVQAKAMGITLHFPYE